MMAERLVEVLRDEGSLALTTEEAQSKSEALLDAGFLTVDLSTLPRAETVSTGPYNEQLRIGSVSMKTTWGDGESAEAYATRHMELALDHIAAAKWVAENPPPPPPVYRDEKRAVLTWIETEAHEGLTAYAFVDARHSIYSKLGWDSPWDANAEPRLLHSEPAEGGSKRHLFGMVVTRKVRVEEES